MSDKKLKYPPFTEIKSAAKKFVIRKCAANACKKLRSFERYSHLAFIIREIEEQSRGKKIKAQKKKIFIIELRLDENDFWAGYLKNMPRLKAGEPTKPTPAEMRQAAWVKHVLSKKED